MRMLDASFFIDQVQSLALRGTVLLLGAALASLLLTRAAAAARHLVWKLAILALLIAPVLPAVLPAWHLRLSAQSTPENVPELFLHHPPGAPVLSTAHAPTLAARMRALPAAALQLGRDSQMSWQPSATVLSAAYALGLLACLFRVLLGWLGVRRLLARARVVTDPGWTSQVAQLGAQLGLRKDVQLLQSAAHHTPLCAGVFRPAIVLPADAAAWSLPRRRVVLLHELAHIRRGDCQSQLLAQLACALHFFNPLCWLAARRMRVERELACDDLVLHAGTRPSEYASHLLAMAQRGGLPGLAQASVAMLGRGKLERRLVALLDARRSHHPLSRSATAAAMLTAAALLIPVAALRAHAELGGPLPAALASSMEPAGVLSAHEGPPLKLLAAVQSYLQEHHTVPPELSQDLRRVELTIDPAIQSVVDEELTALLTRWQALGATAVVLAPASGHILALGSRAAQSTNPQASAPAAVDRDLAVQTAFEPGSTMKIFTVATALELHTVRPEDVFDCENGAWQTGHGTLRDARPHGKLDVGQILAVSSNIGAQKIYKTFGAAQLLRSLTRFHFGEQPAVQFPAASPGVLPSGGPLTDERVANVASGQGLSASPLQTAAAFAAIANGGVYQPPTLVRRITSPTGAVVWQPPPSSERVVSAATASTVLRLLQGTVQGPMGTGKGAHVPGYLVAGKTGTASQSSPQGVYGQHYYGSFVGAIPAHQPAVVILVGVDGPRGEYTGGTVAAPAFARIAQRVMTHLQVPADGTR